MKRTLKAILAAAGLSVLVAMETMAVQSPGGSIVEDGESSTGSDTGVPPIGEIGGNISEDLLDILEDYYIIDENGIPLARLPESENSPKTGEDNTLILVSGAGMLSLAGAFALFQKEQRLHKKNIR